MVEEEVWEPIMICEKCGEFIEAGTDDNYNIDHSLLICPNCGQEYVDDLESNAFLQMPYPDHRRLVFNNEEFGAILVD
jgi:DNA-directed RNA polymerase subunit M/transcription elongation factor TFIIS